MRQVGATKPSRELDESKPKAQLESSRRSVLKLGEPQANLAPQTAKQSKTVFERLAPTCPHNRVIIYPMLKEEEL